MHSKQTVIQSVIWGMAIKVADVTVTSNTSVDIIKESADIIFEQKDLQLLEEMILMGRKVETVK